MTDQLEEMFARTRASVLPSVRPPGVAAARRTVRRRRAATAVAAAAVVLAAILGTAVVFRPGPPVSADPAYLALLAGRPATPALEWKGPAYQDYYRREQVYAPALTLRVACSGAGRITLVVEGRPGVQGITTKLAEAPVVCGPEPIVVERRIMLASPITSEIVIRLTGVTGVGNFAYRLTSDWPTDPTDPANSPVDALGRPGETQTYTVAGALVPKNNWQEVEEGVQVEKRRFTLVAACGGEGMMKLEMWQATGAYAYLEVPCSWPPVRQELLADTDSLKMSLWVKYESRNPAWGQFAVAVIRK